MVPAYTMAEAMLAFGATASLLVGGMFVLSWLVRPLSRRPEAEETYECGMPAEGSHRGLGFNFIGYAALFLVFDLAALYLFLYAIAEELSLHVTITFFSGIGILLLLIAYGTRKRRYYVA